MISLFRLLLVSLLLGLLGGVTANFNTFAQSSGSTTGAIVGSVKDTQGNVLADAVITVRQTDTNLTRTTKSDTTGAYQILQLPPGEYQLKIEANGFTAKIWTLTL